MNSTSWFVELGNCDTDQLAAINTGIRLSRGKDCGNISPKEVTDFLCEMEEALHAKIDSSMNFPKYMDDAAGTEWRRVARHLREIGRVLERVIKSNRVEREAEIAAKKAAEIAAWKADRSFTLNKKAPVGVQVTESGEVEINAQQYTMNGRFDLAVKGSTLKVFFANPPEALSAISSVQGMAEVKFRLSFHREGSTFEYSFGGVLQELNEISMVIGVSTDVFVDVQQKPRRN